MSNGRSREGLESDFKIFVEGSDFREFLVAVAAFFPPEVIVSTLSASIEEMLKDKYAGIYVAVKKIINYHVAERYRNFAGSLPDQFKQQPWHAKVIVGGMEQELAQLIDEAVKQQLNQEEVYESLAINVRKVIDYIHMHDRVPFEFSALFFPSLTTTGEDSFELDREKFVARIEEVRQNSQD